MKRWFKYIKPYAAYFITGPLCMIVEVVGEIFMPYFMAQIINNYSAGNLTIGSSLGYMIGMVLTALAMMLGGVGGAYFGAKASVNFAADIRNDVYKKVQAFSFANIDRFSTGSLVTRLTNDVTQLQNFVNMVLRMALRAPGMMIGALVMSIALEPRLSMIFLVSMPVLLAAIFVITKMGFPRFTKMQTKIDGLNSTVQENITNVRVVKSFVREDFEQQKFAAANSDLKKTGMGAMKVMIFLQPIMSLCMYSTIIAAVWFGSKLVMNSGMAVGNLSAFITYVTQILMSLLMVTMLFMFSSRAMASAKRISEVLDEPLDLSDETAKHKDLTIKRGKIEFKKVDFRYYKTSKDAVLSNIDLTIEPGQTVGIIGSTGCGKTTLVSLIPRLYDCDKGQVLVDGVDVKDYSLYNLREGIGMVLQKNVLFSGSISDNLRWGDLNATDEQITDAAKKAQADMFVKSFPNGYETILDQGGTNVSGGQKQRLCIARALLKHPKILILDDSTSAVDTATEANIREAFANELSDATKIIIAQRISSVKEADKIIVMDDGKIVGEGTNDDLLKNNETYREIYYSQIDKEEL
jgi:ATP-binding cassette subfamily B multidrug efflux pump